ncbi:hypothetical protein Q4S45_22695 [Massilia sp. R2A-15]|uniref:hypothetical protein n=1 Tax=Massilia sp. R2A-15 TaxID=3064278 RepID=UPI002732D809|nr:hypothetical protein [Massilia sp. R2A-15]WLI89467.1 hypothetical protein Q4S45_22695 [Massilia sp. R2A-15]
MEDIQRKTGDVVVIKLGAHLFTLAQFLASPSMRFYDISNATGTWKNIDLNKFNPLFSVFVSREVLQNLVVGRVDQSSVMASIELGESLWIKPHLNFDGGFAFRGGNLIDIGPDGRIETTEAPVIKADLSLPEDRKLIEKYELTNMWGAEPLRERLARYFETGINRDDLKFEVFPGLWSDRKKLRPLTSRLPVPLR